MEKTGAVILAAGGSSRLGKPKQFLIHRGQTLLSRAVGAAAECSPVVVVAGRDGRRVEEELRSRTVFVVHHEHWQCGIGGSICAGVTRALEISPDLDSIVLLVCDQIHVTADLVMRMRQMREEEQKPIVACCYAEIAGVPALFARALFPKLQTLGDANGAKEIISQGGELVSRVPFPHGAIDIDSSADAFKYLGRSG
jgi:molybdenum cofactor cytidylyltransferase